MSDYTIVDRRNSPSGKNLSNRQRFLQRTKEWVKKQVRDRSTDRQITSKDGESITISKDDVSEPSFDYDFNSGNWNRTLPGNKEYITGDKIKRPPPGKGKGTDASDSGEGEDDFTFSLSRDEYLGILFEDLELPDLVKESENAAVTFARKRAGYSVSGTPNNLDLVRSIKNSLGRRIALAFPLDKKIKDKEQELEAATDEQKPQLELELSELKRRRLAVAYIDQVDVRYKRHVQVPIPNSQAVVFCLMDVSGSMGEPEKDTAKRFFLLLYLFLQRKYQKVDIVFVRHTTVAAECTEEEFFYSKESGGTIVSSGVKEVDNIIKARYPADTWNIYVTQASDGDNFNSDNTELRKQLDSVLPKCQYYVYNEVLQKSTYSSYSSTTNVMDVMKSVAEEYENLNIVSIGEVNDVVGKFREVFTKRTPNVK